MPQPSGQVLVNSGHSLAGTLFAYAHNNGGGGGMWDATNGAMLTKVGTGAVATEGGATVVTSASNTYYTLASPITPGAGAFSIGFRARMTANDARSIFTGNHTNTGSYIWLNSSGQARIQGTSIGANGGVTTLATWWIVRDGQFLPARVYKDGVLTGSISNSQGTSVTISAILKGLSGSTANDFHGSAEFFHLFSGIALTLAQIESLTADPYQMLQVAAGVDAAVAGTGTMSWSAAGAVDASGVAPLTAAAAGLAAMSWAAVGASSVTISSGAIALTAPAAYRMHQRNVATNTASVTISGTYSGSPGSIQYRFAGGAWAALVASPSGGTFSQAVTLPTGQGALEVRFSSDTGVAASSALVGVGDIYIVAGQSNHVGLANEAVAPVASAFTAVMFDRSDAWKPLQEGTTQATSFDGGVTSAKGSYIGALSNRLQSNGVPVAFIPIAVGSTRVDQWQRYDPAPTDPYFNYGRMLGQWQQVGGGRAMLWWQGESDASSSTAAATFESLTNELINDWWTDTGTPVFMVKITNFHANAPTIRASQDAIAAGNTNVIGIADGGGAYSGDVHYLTATQINAVADAVYTPFEAAFYPDPLTVDVAGEGSMQWAGLGAISADVFDYVPAVSFVLTTNGITPAANITGIQWAWWDATPPDLSSAPVANGTTSTDADGTVALTITGSTLAVGQVGTMLLMTGDGTPGSSANRAFCAPVEVV